MMAESVLIMNVITDKLRGKYLLRIKTLVSSDINGEHFTMVRTKKNIDFMYEYGLSIEDVKNIILNLSTEDCFSGPENDRDLSYEGWIFKFSPMFENKGVKVDTFMNVAVCKSCNNDLYVNDLEKENMKRVYVCYSLNTDIIKPSDIIDFRNKYGLSQRELTSILSFGKMTINRYENGYIPTKTQSDYIKMLINNEEEFIKKVSIAYRDNLISEKTYKKVISTDILAKITKKDVQDDIRKYLEVVMIRKPDIYNGYKEFNMDKLENIISYIASKVDNLTITSLNKYLWFIDMLSFNKRAISITGLTYQKQQYGPTIMDGLYEEISLLDDLYERKDIETTNGNITNILSKGNFNLSLINEKEKEIIDTIIETLKNKKVNEISTLSHKEEGWKKTKNLDRISFEYKFNLLSNLELNK